MDLILELTNELKKILHVFIKDLGSFCKTIYNFFIDKQYDSIYKFFIGTWLFVSMFGIFNLLQFVLLVTISFVCGYVIGGVGYLIKEYLLNKNKDEDDDI